MYRLEDLNLGDKVTMDGGETGTVVCIMTDDYKDEQTCLVTLLFEHVYVHTG